jgi:hypothetical protein
VWVPAHSAVKTWLLVGPVTGDHTPTSCEIRAVAYDRSDASDAVHRPPDQLAARGAVYRERHDANTAILLDEEKPDDEDVFGRLPEPPSRDEEALTLARTFRAARNMPSGLVTRLAPGALPPMPQAFDGIDHLIIASRKVADDPVGLRAVREWVGQGGTVWVMLDMVDPEGVAPLLGDAFDFRLVDRTSLTTIRFERHPPELQQDSAPPSEFERPVEFARVMLPRGEPVLYTVNGWPAWFSRRVGRGKVVFSTLGARAWLKPRGPRDESPYKNFPNLPAGTPAFDALAGEIQPSPTGSPFSIESLRPVLAEEVGYTVVRRTTLALVFAAFLLGTLALALVLRRTRRPELLGWIAPAAALVAAVAFVAIGEASRRSAPPTVAVVQLVDAAAGHGEAPVHGLLAVYRPDSGPAEVGPRRGGFFALDLAGVEEQPHRLILTDLDSWHWEDLSLPAGVRTAPFRYTAASAAPLSAVARLGPDGLEGRLDAGPFRDPADALLNTATGRNLAVRLSPDGTFRAGGEDVLPAGQFLAGTVLSDRQQRRQRVYREMLARSGRSAIEGRNVLYAWAEPIDMGFDLGPGARSVGGALLAVPLRLERPAAGERVTIPGSLVGCRRILESGPTRVTLEADNHADQRLRFQLPPEVLPFKVERARLVARIDAPGRRVTVSGVAGDTLIELHRADSPLDPIRVEIAEDRLLRLDGEGGLYLDLDVSAAAGATQKWVIEYLELDVIGRAE